MPEKSYIDWHFEHLDPSLYKNFKDWAFYVKTGTGVTVVRLFGFTVRVVK